MMDWYLGQAGFGEQLERYGDAYWRQMGTDLLWAFIIIWAILVVVAIIVAVARQADPNPQPCNERAFARMLAAMHTAGPLVPRPPTARPMEPRADRPDETTAPLKVA